MAESARTWKTESGVQHVLLERDVKIAIGSYAFGAKKAAIQITPSPRPNGDLTNSPRIIVYM